MWLHLFCDFVNLTWEYLKIPHIFDRWPIGSPPKPDDQPWDALNWKVTEDLFQIGPKLNQQNKEPSIEDISGDVIRMDCAILRNSYLTKTNVLDYKSILWKYIEVSYLRTGACRKNAWAGKDKVQWGYEQA